MEKNELVRELLYSTKPYGAERHSCERLGKIDKSHEELRECPEIETKNKSGQG